MTAKDPAEYAPTGDPNQGLNLYRGAYQRNQ